MYNNIIIMVDSQVDDPLPCTLVLCGKRSSTLEIIIYTSSTYTCNTYYRYDKPCDKMETSAQTFLNMFFISKTAKT